MLRLTASYRKAKAAADTAMADTLPMDLRFALNDGARRVRITLTMGDGPGAEPFAARELTAAELDRLVFDLDVLREGLRLGAEAEERETK